ncbi:unnamed protein product [Rotaria socialis]|uniref:NACHT domain-containing protein n=1 Tax=Rotaria socialis TaxID=392032 RepID=A0A821RDM8_9BILA|nr:unnamed protein product [Rotaria socialis]CAF4840070.1 unnamed protein product [Rotaria socialis]
MASLEELSAKYLRDLLKNIDFLLNVMADMKKYPHECELISKRMRVMQRVLSKLDKSQLDHVHLANLTELLRNLEEFILNYQQSVRSAFDFHYRDFGDIALQYHKYLAHFQMVLVHNRAEMKRIEQEVYKEQKDFKNAKRIAIEKELEKLRSGLVSNPDVHNALLQKLNEHWHIMEPYLNHLIQLHRCVPLNGLDPDTVSQVATTLYNLTQEQATILEHELQSFELPLEKTFILLRPDRSTAFERNASRRILTGSSIYLNARSLQKADKNTYLSTLMRAPYMPSMIERDRFEESGAKYQSYQDVLSKHRWLVVLGDPGSGKTSFVRWLVTQMSKALCSRCRRTTSVRFIRMPILIRVGEFAEALSKSPTLTLFDYIGKHEWMGKPITNNLEDKEALIIVLQDFIKQGHVVVILDGLDEIPVSDLRIRIVNLVENFVDSYVKTPNFESAFDESQFTDSQDNPSESGGNQLLVTSRIVGYHAAPLSGNFVHYIIKPMDKERIKEFVDFWFSTVHEQILSYLNIEVENQSGNQANSLKQEFDDPDKVGLLELASNPCLLSFICTVAFQQSEGSSLPNQRILLYEQTVESMLNTWKSKGSTINIPKLIRILCDIASFIHKESPSGLIHEELMKNICIESIKTFTGKKSFSASEDNEIKEQTEAFVRIIREDVGIIAARGQSLYGFLHLTFQEYFTCLKLSNVESYCEEDTLKKESENRALLVAHSLRSHVFDPHFRIPLFLALGRLSLEWKERDFTALCTEFIKENNVIDSPLPIGAYLLITSTKDLVNQPSAQVYSEALDQLMVAAGLHKWSTIFPLLIDHIILVLRQLPGSIVSEWIAKFLSKMQLNVINSVSALCYLLGKDMDVTTKWIDQMICEKLVRYLPSDCEENSFAVDCFLVKIAFRHEMLLPAYQTGLKGFLTLQAVEVSTIHPSVLSAIICIYGGVSRKSHILFEPQNIHRESPVLTPILIRYFTTVKGQSHDEKVNELVKNCKKTLIYLLENNLVVEATDVVIVILCLVGIEYLWQHEENIKLIIWLKVLARMKNASRILRHLYVRHNLLDVEVENEAKTFFLRSIQQYKQKKTTLSEDNLWKCFDTFRSVLVRLRSAQSSFLMERMNPDIDLFTVQLPKCIQFLIRDKQLLLNDLTFKMNQTSCSSLPLFVKLFWILEDDNDTSSITYRFDKIVKHDLDHLLFRNKDPFFVLTFIPDHLRPLFEQLIKKKHIPICFLGTEDSMISSDDHCLYFAHILVECLMNLSTGVCKQFPLALALYALLPWLLQCKLENFACSLLWFSLPKDSFYIKMLQTAQNGLFENDSKIMDYFSKDHLLSDGQRIILVSDAFLKEYDRMVQDYSTDEQRNIALFAACTSLARLCMWSANKDTSDLSSKIVMAAMTVTNPLIRLDVLCSMCFSSPMSVINISIPSTNRTLQAEIQDLAIKCLPDCPLLVQTAMFIRCLPFLVAQPQVMENVIENLLKNLNDAEIDEKNVILKALYPYCRSCRALEKYFFNHLTDPEIICSESCNLRYYFDIAHSRQDKSLTNLTLVSSIYILGLTRDIHFGYTNLVENLLPTHTLENGSRVETNILSQLSTEILTLHMACAISYALRPDMHMSPETYESLNRALHSIRAVELKVRPILHHWMIYEPSSKYYSFACHAALLCLESKLWSVEAVNIACDMLTSDFDRFRQRAQVMVHQDNSTIRQTSSQIGINVFLTLEKRYAILQHQCPHAALALSRQLYRIEIDNVRHLDDMIWLEKSRFRSVHINNKFTVPSHKCITSFVRTKDISDVSFCDSLWRLSAVVVRHLCEHIKTVFEDFKLVDDVIADHNKFVANVLISFIANFMRLLKPETQSEVINSLFDLLESSSVDINVRQAASYCLGFVQSNVASSKLLNVLQSLAETYKDQDETIICILINAVSHSWAKNDSLKSENSRLQKFLENLLHHSSPVIINTASSGLARIMGNNEILLVQLENIDLDCYHALISATADLFVTPSSEKSVVKTAEFIDSHPDLLPIFASELYDNIQHYTEEIIYEKDVDSMLKYRRPQYVNVAAELAERMPAAFCAFFNEWVNGDELKQVLYYTSKQHDFTRRAACLTVLSFFGELTTELTEMLVHALLDDPHVQNICYKCVKRIHSVKDKIGTFKALLNVLKSNSMNARYVAVKLLLNLSQSGVFQIEHVQQALLEMIRDPTSDEGLWLVEEQEKTLGKNNYYYAGSLKDVVYSLLVKHLIGDASDAITKQNEKSELYSDFVESDKAARLAACIFDDNDDNGDNGVIDEDYVSVENSSCLDLLQMVDMNQSTVRGFPREVPTNPCTVSMNSSRAMKQKSSFCSLL